jgi:hypothetical protein
MVSHGAYHDGDEDVWRRKDHLHTGTAYEGTAELLNSRESILFFHQSW